MRNKNLSKLYFSATETTKTCVDGVASAMEMPVAFSANLADRNHAEVPEFSEGDTVIVASPVYGGRLPELMVEKLKEVKGGGACAIAMVVYGNRDYDDALLELADTLTEQGFRIIGAAAFVAQHSIFPKVAAGRPDTTDKVRLAEFGRRCRKLLDKGIFRELQIKGKRPYKKYSGVPVHPVGKESLCVSCGMCAELCPAEAIDRESPWETDADRCISCGRCIKVCKESARRYEGIKYSMLGTIFKSMVSKRKEAEFFL